MTKVDAFTQRVSAYQKECRTANRRLDINVLERIVAEIFTIEERRDNTSADRMITEALNQTRGIV